MSLPELWTRCPKVEPKWLSGGFGGTWAWLCECSPKRHGQGRQGETPLGLVQVPLDKAVDRGARALCYHRTECDTYWDERPETHDDWRRSAEAVLLAALGEGT
jgi:hypothetical protein